MSRKLQSLILVIVVVSLPLFWLFRPVTGLPARFALEQCQRVELTDTGPAGEIVDAPAANLRDAPTASAIPSDSASAAPEPSTTAPPLKPKTRDRRRPLRKLKRPTY